MKRIIIFLLVAAMLFSAVACTKNEGKKPTDTTPETPKEPEFIIDPNDPVMTDILNSKIKLHFNSNAIGKIPNFINRGYLIIFKINYGTAIKWDLYSH